MFANCYVSAVRAVQARDLVIEIGASLGFERLGQWWGRIDPIAADKPAQNLEAAAPVEAIRDLMVLPAEAEKRQLKCIICYQDIDFDAPDMVRCKYCGTVAHHEHIMQWVAAAGKKCPRCMSELELE